MTKVKKNIFLVISDIASIHFSRADSFEELPHQLEAYVVSINVVVKK